MRKELQLIALYCAVCRLYDSAIVYQAQRCSNNFCPTFTDVECMVIYIWGILNQKYDVKACYNFINYYYGDWFPDLPSYQAYNSRVCFLADAFKMLASSLVCERVLDLSHRDFIYDSLPIIVAGSKRSGSAKVADTMCSKGYCASKDMWYYGVKLHIVAQSNYKALPTPALMMVSRASEHDFPIAKAMLDDAMNIRVFSDTALVDKSWQAAMLSENNVEVLTPIKRKQGKKKLAFWDAIYSTAISSVKQVIESFNNWIIEKTNIQRASKVRSAAGLTSFIFARIASACFVF